MECWVWECGFKSERQCESINLNLPFPPLIIIIHLFYTLFQLWDGIFKSHFFRVSLFMCLTSITCLHLHFHNDPSIFYPPSSPGARSLGERESRDQFPKLSDEAIAYWWTGRAAGFVSLT